MNPNIIIKITADIKAFLANLQQGFGQATQQAQAFANNVKSSLTNAFNTANTAQIQFQQTSKQLGQALLYNRQQLDALKVAGTSYYGTINSVVVSQNRIKAVTQDLVDIQARYGVSLRQAAQIAIETGRVGVYTVNQVLIANGRLPLSIKENEQALTNLATNVNRAAQGLPLITSASSNASQGLNSLGDASNKTSEKLSFLAMRLRGVLTNLIIVTAVFKFVQLMQSLAANADEVAQSMFNFEASLKAAQLTLGPVVGSTSAWTETIKRLRTEFQVFSERDIRGAVTQTLNLTKALSLTQDQMTDIIRVAAALAKTTGVDLKDAVEDIVHALGGSKVVLDKYGLFLRDSDLRTVSFSLGLGKNTAALTSQQLALVTLNAIMAQTSNLMQATGDYTENFAGQVKQAGAEASDTSDRISGKLGGLTLAFKLMYVNFLTSIEGMVDKFKPLLDFIDSINAKAQELKKEQAAGISQPRYQDYKGLYLNNGLQELNKAARGYLGQEAIDKFTNGQLTSGQLSPLDAFSPYSDPTALNKYIADLKAYNDKVQLMKSKALGPDRNKDDYFAAPKTDNLSDKEQSAVDKFGTDVSDLLQERVKRLQDAKDKYYAELRDLNDQNTKALQKLDSDFADAKAKLAQKTGFSNTDAATKYNRDLEDLQTNTDQKLADAEEKKNEKLKDNKKKFYDDLKQLDREYYFSLFDAVAANDAVAIKQAERKYNLDKQKLQDKLNDENNATEDNYNKTIEQIRRDTEDRKVELKKRYDRELADIALQNARELAQLIADHKKEIISTNKHYDDLRAALDTKYENEKIIIGKEEKAKYDKLVADLLAELTAHQDNWALIIKGTAKYFADLITEEEQYYIDREKLKKKYDHGGGGTDSHGCLVGWHWSDLQASCVPNTGIASPSPSASFLSTDTNGNTIKLIIGSDGTLSDDIVNKVVGEVANVIQDIIVQRG